MVIITKAEAKERRMDSSYVCKFHEHNPDQRAIQDGLCPDCIYIQDSCGCGLDEGCIKCSPEDFTEVKQNGKNIIRNMKN